MPKPYLYNLVILGSPTNIQAFEIKRIISQHVKQFHLKIGQDISWSVCPKKIIPILTKNTAVAFFGSKGCNKPSGLHELLSKAIPILPIVTDLKSVQDEIPPELRPYNCLDYGVEGAQGIAFALLECLGLLPRQRRIFISYRREETGFVAQQLYNEFSSRLFDVFLDTYSILPGDNFQNALWHRLCDSDVLIILHTSDYFESRWTSSEFGRALAKGISVFCIDWPDTKQSSRLSTANHLYLNTTDINISSSLLSDVIVEEICNKVEEIRSESCAVRTVNLVSSLRIAVEKIGGKVEGLGLKNSVLVQLADGRFVIVFTNIGVPTSKTLHDVVLNNPTKYSAGVIYDPIGITRSWVEHLDWLGNYITEVRWIKLAEAAWQLADWV